MSDRSSPRFQFSLRLCLLLICLASVLSAWMYWRSLMPSQAPGRELHVNPTGQAEHALLYDVMVTDGDFYGPTLKDPVQDSDLAIISRYRTLKVLEIRGRNVTDNGIAHLSKLRNLRHLEIYAPKVTDAGLPHLADLDKLSTLDLDGCAVTDEGIDQLQQELPNCQIFRSRY